MADRHLLLIDTDDQFHVEFARILAPYGVHVDVVNDGTDGLGRAAAHPPEVIIIAVDLPDKVGYGICNKAKKGVAKSLPVMLATATIPPADLEQHRRLKVHADEYIDKRTITEDDLLAKIDYLIGLGAPMEDVPIEDLNVEPEEIAFDDEGDDFVAEATSVSSLGVNSLMNLGVDPGIDAETDAVFAGLVEHAPMVSTPLIDDERTPAPPPRARASEQPQYLSTPPPTTPPIPTTKVIPAMPTRQPAGNGVSAAPQTVPPAPTPPIPAPLPPPESTIEGEDDHRAEHAAALEALRAAAHEEVEAARAQTHELETEVHRLRAALEEARKSPAPVTNSASSFSREREFLNLREVINRKDKDLLDLKDELDGKDRLILGGKEKIRELERKLRDSDEKTLHFEQELVNAREALAALRDDKDKGIEREKGLKTRLDLAQAQGKKTEEELDLHKKKTSAELAAHKEESAARQKELEREKREAGAMAVSLQDQLAAAVRRAEEEKAALAKTLTSKMTNERAEAIGALRSEHNELVDKLKKEHLGEMNGARDEHRTLVARIQSEHGEIMGRADKDHHAAIVKAAEEKNAAVAMAEERRKRELVDNDEMWRAEAKAADRRREKELQTKDDEHKKVVAELTGTHAQKLDKLDKDHREAARVTIEQAAKDQAATAERHRQELATAEQRRVREITLAGEEHARQLEATAARHTEALAGATMAHDQALARLGKEHDEAKNVLAQTHAAKVVTLETESGRLARSLAGIEERHKQLEAQHAEIDRLAREHGENLARTTTDLAQRSEDLAAMTKEHETLARDHGEVQDQLMKAYQRLRAEEAAVAKAKKALALALMVLDAEASPPSVK